MKIKYCLIVLTLFCISQTSQAQIALDTIYVSNKKTTEDFIGIRYYYYPNLETYFDTKRALYIHKENGSWITSELLTISRGYSSRNGFYVMIKGYTGDEPYTLFELHKQKYPADYSTRRKPKNIASLN
jgi:hypothetical protein